MRSKFNCSTHTTPPPPTPPTPTTSHTYKPLKHTNVHAYARESFVTGNSKDWDYIISTLYLFILPPFHPSHKSICLSSPDNFHPSFPSLFHLSILSLHSFHLSLIICYFCHSCPFNPILPMFSRTFLAPSGFFFHFFYLSSLLLFSVLIPFFTYAPFLSSLLLPLSSHYSPPLSSFIPIFSLSFLSPTSAFLSFTSHHTLLPQSFTLPLSSTSITDLSINRYTLPLHSLCCRGILGFLVNEFDLYWHAPHRCLLL